MVSFRSCDEALDEFKAVYFDKTGNKWSDRKDFRKRPNKFYPLELDFGDHDEETMKRISLNQQSTSSKLDRPIQSLIQLIFDVEKMKNIMVEFDIDLAKMPLGKLSENQLRKAFGVLNELTMVSINSFFVFA